jgi:hypothetical protein
MLKLLLDEHISPEVANGVRRRNRSLVIHSMAQWESGNFLGKEDSVCLLEAAKQWLTLVTYDRSTIPPLLKLWAEEDRCHGGVIFVDEKTISPANIGGLVHALISLANEAGEIDYTNQVYLLRSGRPIECAYPSRSRLDPIAVRDTNRDTHY